MNGVRFHAFFLSGTVKRCRCVPFTKNSRENPQKRFVYLFTSRIISFIIYSVLFFDSGGETFVNSDFPRILTLLRKEQGISQKKAAADLGIS